LYIDPAHKGDYDAGVTMWVRASEVGNGLDSILYKTVKNWISTSWPFKKVAYPGREIPWQEWKDLK
jgi:hypothetical protein